MRFGKLARRKVSMVTLLGEGGTREQDDMGPPPQISRTPKTSVDPIATREAHLKHRNTNH